MTPIYDTVIYGSCLLGNQLLSFQGRDKDRVHSEMYQQLYFLIKSGSVKFTANQYFYRLDKFCVRAEALEGGPASRALRYCHKIVKKDKKMMKNGKVILHVSQLQAINKFEQFIEGSEYLIAHGSIDFETIRFLLEKTRDSQIYHGIQKVDSQDF